MLKQSKPRSFNRRIIVTTSLSNLIFWLIACLVAAFVMYEEYEEAFDGALQLSATRLLPMAITQWKNNSENEISASAHEPEYSTYQLLDTEGRVLLRSAGAPLEPYNLSLKTGFSYTSKWRIYSLTSDDGLFFIQVADRMSERREAAIEAMTALAVPALIFIPLTMLILAALLKRQLRSVQYLSMLISEKDSGNMQPIERQGLQQEFLPIIASVNHLLERLKSALEAERSFTANSAHELRMPIAGALAHTQLLLQELPKYYWPRAREIEMALQRLRHLSEKLLQLARADARVGATETAIDLIPFIEAVVEDFRRIGNTNRLIIDARINTLICQVNGDAFGIILRNLLENALGYSPESSLVKMTISSSHITISNDCESINAENLTKMGKRFYRGTQEGQGVGLGLSIVEALLKSMPISIHYQSPIEGQNSGFCATLTLREPS